MLIAYKTITKLRTCGVSSRVHRQGIVKIPKIKYNLRVTGGLAVGGRLTKKERRSVKFVNLTNGAR